MSHFCVEESKSKVDSVGLIAMEALQASDIFETTIEAPAELKKKVSLRTVINALILST